MSTELLDRAMPRERSSRVPVAVLAAAAIAMGASYTPIIRTLKPRKSRVNKYALCRCGSRKLQAHCCGY